MAEDDLCTGLLREKKLYEKTSMELVHDLRNPLNVLQGYIDLLEEELEGREELEEDVIQYLEKIGRTGEQMEEILDSGAALLGGEQYDDIDIYQALRDCVDTYEDRAQKEGIDIWYEGPDTSQYMHTDVRVPRVFDNLVENTLAHATGADEAVFHAHDEEDAVVVEYTDNGPGMPSEIQGAVAEFGEKDETSEGLGWGMALSAHILEEAGAECRTGDAEGDGFVMEMRFPYTAATDE